MCTKFSQQLLSDGGRAEKRSSESKLTKQGSELKGMCSVSEPEFVHWIHNFLQLSQQDSGRNSMQKCKKKKLGSKCQVTSKVMTYICSIQYKDNFHRGRCRAPHQGKWIFSWVRRSQIIPHRGHDMRRHPTPHSSRLPRATGLTSRGAQSHEQHGLQKQWSSSNSFVDVPSTPQLAREAPSRLVALIIPAGPHYFCWNVVQRTAARKFGLFDTERHWENYCWRLWRCAVGFFTLYFASCLGGNFWVANSCFASWQGKKKW